MKTKTKNKAKKVDLDVGGKRDKKNLENLIRQSYEERDPCAQSELGELYLKGSSGVQKNEKEAVCLFRLSAEQGNAEGEKNLAIMYFEGCGVEEDEKEAARLFQLSAAQGNPKAQYYLGLMNFEGWGVETNLHEALLHYRLSAEQGVAKAQFNLGKMYLGGYEECVEKDEEEAVRFFRFSSEQGNADAQSALGIMYLEGRGGLERDEVSAHQLFQLSSDQNHPVGQFHLGLMYLEGCVVERNEKKGIQLFQQSSEQGNLEALWNLGVLHLEGRGVEQKDEKEAARLFRLGCDRGDSLAQCNLAIMYLKGMGLEKDLKEAVKLFGLSAQQGNEVAQWQLGMLYLKGEGVDKADPVEANRLFQLSSEQGNHEAQFNLGVSYSTGSGVPKDEQKAAQLFRECSNRGDPVAQYNLGILYLNGRGVPQNLKEAAHLFTLSSEQGHANAQFHLGIMYLEGWGVEKNEKESIHYFLVSSGQGNASSQYYLGNLFLEGNGVEKNEKEAARLFQLSSEQGNPSAQVALGNLYWEGRGVSRNEKEAIRQFRLSSEQGGEQAEKHLRKLADGGRLFHKSASGPDASFSLARVYLSSPKFTDFSKAAVYLKSAIKKGSLFAVSWLGVSWEYGLGKSRSRSRAIELYCHASDKGCPLGQIALGICLLRGFVKLEGLRSGRWGVQKGGSNSGSGGAVNGGGLTALLHEIDATPPSPGENPLAEALFQKAKNFFSAMEFNQRRTEEWRWVTDFFERVVRGQIKSENKKACQLGANMFLAVVFQHAGIFDIEMEDEVKSKKYLSAAAEFGDEWSQYQLGAHPDSLLEKRARELLNQMPLEEKLMLFCAKGILCLFDDFSSLSTLSCPAGEFSSPLSLPLFPSSPPLSPPIGLEPFLQMHPLSPESSLKPNLSFSLPLSTHSSNLSQSQLPSSSSLPQQPSTSSLPTPQLPAPLPPRLSSPPSPLQPPPSPILSPLSPLCPFSSPPPPLPSSRPASQQLISPPQQQLFSSPPLPLPISQPISPPSPSPFEPLSPPLPLPLSSPPPPLPPPSSSLAQQLLSPPPSPISSLSSLSSPPLPPPFSSQELNSPQQQPLSPLSPIPQPLQPLSPPQPLKPLLPPSSPTLPLLPQSPPPPLLPLSSFSSTPQPPSLPLSSQPPPPLPPPPSPSQQPNSPSQQQQSLSPLSPPLPLPLSPPSSPTLPLLPQSPPPPLLPLTSSFSTPQPPSISPLPPSLSLLLSPERSSPQQPIFPSGSLTLPRPSSSSSSSLFSSFSSSLSSFQASLAPIPPSPLSPLPPPILHSSQPSSLPFLNSSFQQNKYEKARFYFKHATKQGSKLAYFFLGLIHEYGLGEGVDCSVVAAMYFYTKADKRFPLFRLMMGVFYLRGWKKTSCLLPDKVASLFRSIDNSPSPAYKNFFSLPFFLSSSTSSSSPTMTNMILNLFQTIANKPGPESLNACLILSILFQEGFFGIERDLEKAGEYWEKVAKNGDPWLWYNIGLMWETGKWGRGEGKEKAEEEKGEEEGKENKDEKEEEINGKKKEKDERKRKNYNEAARWYLLAAERGLQDAQSKLSSFYLLPELEQGQREKRKREAEYWKLRAIGGERKIEKYRKEQRQEQREQQQQHVSSEPPLPFLETEKILPPIPKRRRTRVFSKKEKESLIRKESILARKEREIHGERENVKRARVMYDWEADRDDKLSIKRGEMLYVLYQEKETGWWWCENCASLLEGRVPSNFVLLVEEAKGSSARKSQSLPPHLGKRKNTKRKISLPEMEEVEVKERKIMEMKDFPEKAIPISKRELQEEEELGRGGFGIVTKGTWKGYIVAIKKPLLSLSSFSSPLELEENDPSIEFEKELMTMSNLHHPNVVKLLAFTTDTVLPHLVLEFMDQGTLWSKIGGRLPSQNDSDFLPFPLVLCYQIGLNIAMGLQYIHSMGKIHRDLKSENVFLCGSDYFAKIGDFGLAANTLKNLAQKGLIRFRSENLAPKGTIEWTAPELWKEMPSETGEGVRYYSSLTDVYSFSIILWELVAHDRPLKKFERLGDIIEQVQLGFRDEIPPRTPPILKELIEKGSADNPKIRPTIPEIIAKLEEGLEEEKERRGKKKGERGKEGRRRKRKKSEIETIFFLPDNFVRKNNYLINN